MSFDTSTMRAVARALMPSIKALMIWTRFAVLSTFTILDIVLALDRKVNRAYATRNNIGTRVGGSAGNSRFCNAEECSHIVPTSKSKLAFVGALWVHFPLCLMGGNTCKKQIRLSSALHPRRNRRSRKPLGWLA